MQMLFLLFLKLFCFRCYKNDIYAILTYCYNLLLSLRIWPVGAVLKMACCIHVAWHSLGLRQVCFQNEVFWPVTFSILYADREWLSVCMHIHGIHEFMGKWTMELDVTQLKPLDAFIIKTLLLLALDLNHLSSLVVG